MNFNKSLSILIGLIFAVLQLDAQNWEKWYGMDGLTAKPRIVSEHYDLGYIVGANVSDYESGILMPWIIKTNINGDTLWTKLVSSIETLSIKKIKNSSDGGVLLCGGFKMDDESKPFVAKLNACGEKEWCTILYTYNGSVHGKDIVENSTEDIGLIINQFDETNGAYLIKLNSDGELIWQKPYCDFEQYPDSRQPLAESLILVEDDFLITGNVYWKNPDDDLYPIRPLFTMYDTDGNEKFVLPFGIEEGIIGDANASIQIDSDRFIGVGSYWTDKKDALIMEFDAEGNELNYKIFNSNEIHPTYNSSVLMSTQKINNKYYFMSYAGVEESGNPVTEFSTTDDLFGSGFEVIDLLQHPDSRSPISNMAKTHDDKLLCAMTDDAESDYRIYLTKLNANLEQDSIYTEPYEYDYLCDHPIESGTIYLDDCNIIVGTEEIPIQNEYLEQSKKVNIQTSPNPAKEDISLRLENIEKYNELQLRITSALGQQVYETTLIKVQSDLSIPLSNWQKGVYLVQVYYNGKIVGSNRFVKI